MALLPYFSIAVPLVRNKSLAQKVSETNTETAEQSKTYNYKPTGYCEEEILL